MRFLTLSFVAFAVALSVQPASAQSTLGATAQVKTGPVATCPTSIAFVGAITAGGWPVVPFVPASPNARQVQFKWITSDNVDHETQTITFPSVATTTLNVPFVWGANSDTSGWAQLQITFPKTITSNQAKFALTCPKPGSITAPLPSTPVGNPIHLP